jgi:curved DNA-binding protein CbpA
VDYYTLLQVNPIAEPGTVEAAYDFLSQRFHPDNPDTANPAIYERLVEAYQVLSDPVKRTAYETERSRNKGSDVARGDRNRATIQATRAELLQMLYWRRVESPYKPIITIHEFESILKIPKEQLEFNLWFLRDRGWIARSDNACFVITAVGVSAAEDVADLTLEQQEQAEELLEAVR